MQQLFENWRKFINESVVKPVFNDQTGNKFGVYFDGARPFVNVFDSRGNMHTFMYSSGTSYIRVDPDTGRVLGMSPRTWLPVKDVSARGVYGKYSPGDMGFGKGDPDLWKTLHRFFGEKGMDYQDAFRDVYGNNWAARAANPNDPQGAEIRRSMSRAMEDGAFARDIPRQFGKYPAPNSELGKISQELSQQFPDANLDKLEKTFGRVVRVDGSGSYNRWRRAGSDAFPAARQAATQAAKHIEKLKDPRVRRELKAVENIVPKKPGAWTKFARRIPFLKYLFAAGIAASIVAEADAAYASNGLPGALKVYAEAGIDMTPIIGDIKGVVDLLRLFIKSPDYEKMQRFVDAYKLAGKGATGIKSDPKSVAKYQRQKRIEQGTQKAQDAAKQRRLRQDFPGPPVETLPKDPDAGPGELSDEEKARLGKFVQNLQPGR